MVYGIGVDLVKIRRIEEAVNRWSQRFLNRIFTPIEQEYSYRQKQPFLHLAGRFAVKEAVLKALGTGLRSGVRWVEIEVVNQPSGKPEVRVSGKVKKLLQQHRIDAIHVSISHDTDYAVGQAVLISAQKK
jgi:holo-[acyl-carrier protein] synthase